MNHSIFEVLPVWLLKVAIDLCILYVFINVANIEAKTDTYYNTRERKVHDDFLP